MRQAGFLLTGGRSRRMGRDKALLPYAGKKLLDHIAIEILEACGSVTLIGRPDLYGRFGYPAQADGVDGCGPIGGICTALRLEQAEWNLIVACDLPHVRAADLERILDVALVLRDAVNCVVPLAPDGRLQPLCAAYHSRCLPEVERAIEAKRFKMMDLLAKLDVIRLGGFPPEFFVNVNSPADWEKIEECPIQ